jgi:LmbE family N-acetylglucosaminyl deacetylase
MARNAEFNAIPETGMAKIILDMQKLPVVGTVMMVGAHPDDEDNALLAYLTKGAHVNAYYLVATHGEGGQNEIGPELYEALGVLRSQELASARTIDGAIQLYLGATDFGFSKSGDEALQKWGHAQLLSRMVRVFRQYRPDIVMTHHDPIHGHGHHQAVGRLVLEAVRAAADPSQFPEQIRDQGLQPWQVLKLYVADSREPIYLTPDLQARVSDEYSMSAWADKPTVDINVGAFDPILGRSYQEVGALARSMHKCQGMVRPGVKGDQIVHYRLVESAVGVQANAKEKSVFDGIDTSLNALLAGLNAPSDALTSLRQRIVELDSTVRDVLAGLSYAQPQAVAGDLLRGLQLVREMEREVSAMPIAPADRSLVLQRLADKERDFVQAAQDLFAASLDVTTDDADVVPGQTVTVTAAFWNRGDEPVENIRIHLDLPVGWTVSPETVEFASVTHNQKVEAKFKVTVAPKASYTDAHDNSPVQATADWEVMGVPLSTAGAAEMRVVPVVAVSLTPEKLMTLALDTAVVKELAVGLRNNSKGPITGRVVLDLPKGWTLADSSATEFTLKSEGQETSVPVKVVIPAHALTGRYMIGARAEYGGGESNVGYQVIAYPHINTRYLYKPAQARLAVIDVKVAPELKVGYVSSGFDQVPEYLEEMSVNVHLLTAADLNASDLSQYDTIILGIRAYLSRPDLVANNGRLLDYVRNGGNLIVQYSKTGEWRQDYAPFPITVSSNRVTVEEAPVTVLQPDHVLFNAPNKISAEDWEGWIQERGLYFPNSWAKEYTALTACNDPGEPSQQGPWLIARYGKGTYIYTAYVWYRQLDSLVSGGYRIFANMISLPRVQHGDATH